ARTPDAGYKVRWRDAAGVHRSKKFEHGEKKHAVAFEAEVKRAKRLGYLPQLQAATKTVSEIGVEWRAANLHQKAPATQQLSEWLWDSQVLPHLASARVAELTPADIEAWLGKLTTGTVAKRKAAALLHQVLNFAIKSGYVVHNPCAVADRPKLPAREPVKPPSPAAVERIRRALQERDRPGDAALVAAMAYAGLRPQEALHLTWDDVRERSLLVRAPKTRRFRTVTLLGPLTSDLAEWRLLTGRPFEVVFPTSRGTGWTRTDYGNWRARIWHGTQRSPGVAPQGMRPYDLRHTFISLLLRDPAYSRVEVAAEAGHSLQVQDRTYAHVIAELHGEGSAEAEIRDARAEVVGQGTAETTGQMR
ncbi:MAG: tyrosine-type recombinase/integrase, partial [Gemmatimonadaceae bacterium]